jgi:hypothetical protein
MATFTITLCSEETCSGLDLIDQTGIFATDNPFGYNSPALPVPTLDVDTGVFGYTSYEVQIWKAIPGGLDSTADPDFTFDLLTLTHTVDPITGYVTWSLPFADIGGEPLRSGWWLCRVNAVYTNTTPTTYNYTTDSTFGLIGDIEDRVDELMVGVDPNCACKKGCLKPTDVFMHFLLAKEKSGCCGDYDGFQNTCDWLYNSTPGCSC